MARPLKPDNVRRVHTIRVRVNDGEKSRIEQNAKRAGKTPSDFLRALGTNHEARQERIVATPDREIVLKVLAEHNKQGSNLNQIARAFNRRNDSSELLDFSDVELSQAIKKHDEITGILIGLLKK